MSIITRMLRQDAIYWKYSGMVSGVPTWEFPVQLKVRWEDVKGSGEGSRGYLVSQVYVGQDMYVQDHIMLGTLDGSVDRDPRLEASWEISTLIKTPNIRATEFLRLVQCAPTPLVLLEKNAYGIEAITYKDQTSTTVQDDGTLTRNTKDIVVPVAFRERLSVGEIERARGRYLETDTAWEIPKVYLTQEPSKEDYLVDYNGVEWNIIGWTEAVLRSWWRVVARRKVS